MGSLAVITARSGSKGVKDKNIRLLKGKPLMAYTILAALNSNRFDEVMVSTDSKEYAQIALDWGAKVPFLRSENTSGDRAGSWDVVREVLQGYVQINRFFDSVCLLQPTSPLRTAADIIAAYAILQEKTADAVTSVCECDHPAEYMMQLDESGSMEQFRKNEVDLPRQLLPTYYRLNGAVYVRKIEYSDEKIFLLDKREYAYVMDRRHSVDIDSIEDFEYAEYIMSREL